MLNVSMYFLYYIRTNIKMSWRHNPWCHHLFGPHLLQRCEKALIFRPVVCLHFLSLPSSLTTAWSGNYGIRTKECLRTNVNTLWPRQNLCWPAAICHDSVCKESKVWVSSRYVHVFRCLDVIFCLSGQTLGCLWHVCELSLWIWKVHNQ